MSNHRPGNNRSVTPLRYYYGWNIVGAGFVLQALVVGIVIYAFGTLMLPLVEEFGISRAQMQLCYSLMILLSAVISPVGAFIMERLSIRALVVIGAACFAIGYQVIGRSNGYAIVLLSYGSLLALAQMMLGSMTTGALITRWFDDKRGLGIGIVATGLSFGGLVFPPLAALLVGEYGWRSAFTIYGLVAPLIILGLALFVIRDAPRPTRSTSGDSARQESKAVRSNVERVGYGPLLRSSKLWIFSVVIGGGFLAHSGMFLNLVPYATDAGISLAKASLLVSTVSVLAVVSKILFGMLADRIDYRIALLAALLTNTGGAILLVIAESSYGIMMIAASLLGIGLGGMTPVWGVAVAREYGAESFGRAMGLTRVVASPISMVGPVFAGWMFDRLGSYQEAFFALIVLQLVLCAMILLIDQRKPLRAPLAAGHPKP